MLEYIVPSNASIKETKKEASTFQMKQGENEYNNIALVLV